MKLILIRHGEPVRFRVDVLAALGSVIENGDYAAHVAVFTHGLPINLVVSQVLGLDGIVHFHPEYGSLTRLRTGDAGKIGVISVNENGHHSRIGKVD